MRLSAPSGTFHASGAALLAGLLLFSVAETASAERVSVLAGGGAAKPAQPGSPAAISGAPLLRDPFADLQDEFDEELPKMEIGSVAPAEMVAPTLPAEAAREHPGHAAHAAKDRTSPAISKKMAKTCLLALAVAMVVCLVAASTPAPTKEAAPEAVAAAEVQDSHSVDLLWRQWLDEQNDIFAKELQSEIFDAVNRQCEEYFKEQEALQIHVSQVAGSDRDLEYESLMDAASHSARVARDREYETAMDAAYDSLLDQALAAESAES
mmetsp:Transcript_73800/g.227925  ORF Transcript_73800/g.227925 Transcript_73800/m.227925 type:complete len:266 (+) Transcript_73800:110-907(+)